MKKNFLLLSLVCAGTLAAQTEPAKSPSVKDSTVARPQRPAGDTLPPVDNEVYSYVEESPQFTGGEQAMYDFLRQNLQYPATCSGIKGTVFVNFIIEKDGSISGIHVQKAVPSCSDMTTETVRLIKLMPKWSPGKLNKKTVRCSTTIPVSFVPAAQPPAPKTGN